MHGRPKLPPQSFVYSPLKDPNEIRLLWLGPGRKTDPLCCCLNTINLDTDLQFIEYEALSYTWGERREGYALHEREGDISITPNLHSALTALRSQDGFIVLWIDAVCINQQDNREKAAQILLMRRIFQSSVRVIAWLGEQYENSHLVEGLLFKIEDVDLDSNGTEWDWDLINLGFLPDDDPCWEAFRALIRRPWFRRVWIIQEIVVAKKLVFKCGDWMVNWTVLIQAFTKMRTRNDFRLERSPNDETKETTESGSFSLSRLLFLRCTFTSNEFGMKKLRDLLMLCRDFQATFARDHLFALLGIASDGDNPALAPDYEKSLDVIVKQYARTFILRDQAIDLLYLAGHHGQTRFPSWIPDWTRVRGPRDPLGFSDVPSDVSLSRRGNYHAAGISAKLRFDEDPDTLIVRGALVDVVVQIGKDFSLSNERPQGVPDDIHFLSEYMSDIAAIIISMDSYLTGEDLLDVEWRTLICNLTPDNNEPDEKEFRNAYIATRRWNRIMVETSNPHAVAPPDFWEIYRRAQPFVSSITYKLKGRRFCVTRKGYIGLVPIETKTGDEIAVFDGATVPFVLRQAEKGHGAFYLIGECYVHGIMKGEALGKETVTRDISLI